MVVQLREHLKSRGLPTTGTKAELVERLTESCAAEEKILNSEESLLKSPSDSGLCDGADEDEVLGIDFPAKDLIEVLKEDEDAILGTEPPKEEIHEASRKQVKKLVNDESISAKMKRAKRFGLPLSDEGIKNKVERSHRHSPLDSDERKQLRAERFGLKSASKATGNDEKMDILEKRAKRFGLPVKVGSSVKESEVNVLEKRARRFGLDGSTDDVEVKKRLRAERFGLK